MDNAQNTAQKTKQHTHVPLFHISKRAPLPWKKAWAIRAGAILLAMVFMGIISIPLTGENPFVIYLTILKGNFAYSGRIWTMLYNTAILLCIALALTPAFRMRFWNIGAEGQVLAGGLAVVLCMLFLGDKIPNALLILIMLLAGLAAGALWALIPAFFKAKWETNETLFTLMMNYVAICLVDFTIQALFPKGTGTMGIVNASTRAGWLPRLGNNNYLLPIILIALLTVGIHVYLRYSKQGYEISVVGESENTARYVGINVKKVILRTMLISGAICGFCGFLIVGGYDHSISSHTVGGRGFTAIMVTWLAKFNPVFMFFTALLICFLENGAGQVANDCGISTAYADILVGIVLFFVIGCEFFINYKLHFRKKEKEVA